MSFKSIGDLIVKSTVYNKDGKTVIRSHYDVSAITECSELVECAAEQAQREYSDVLQEKCYLVAFGPDGEVYRCDDIELDEFVSDCRLTCGGKERKFQEFSHVTFSAIFKTAQEIAQEIVMHHVATKDEQHLDLSLVHGVSKSDLDHCHKWGIYTAEQLRNAPDFQVPEGLKEMTSFKVLHKVESPQKEVLQTNDTGKRVKEASLAFDLGVQMGDETRYLHTHAPLYEKQEGVLGVSFALDAETVCIRDQHRKGISKFCFRNPLNQGAISSHLNLVAPEIHFSLRHSDAYVFENGHSKQESLPVVTVKTRHLLEAMKTRCNKGNVYTTEKETFDDGWNLVKTVVIPHDSPVSQLNLSMLQKDEKCILVYCSFYWKKDKHDHVLDLGANVQGSQEIKGFKEIFDDVTVAIRWNGQEYAFPITVGWYFTEGYPVERTRFGDLYVTARNVLDNREDRPSDLPDIREKESERTDVPSKIGLKMTWTNGFGEELVVQDSRLDYQKLFYELENDESGWLPYLVGTVGRGKGIVENFDPRSGDTNLKVLFDLGTVVDIGHGVRKGKVRKMKNPGYYRLKANHQGGHIHYVEVTKGQDGKLSGVSSVGANHVHRVVDGVVQEAAGHTHPWEQLGVLE